MKMGKEVKIGLGVIGVLLALFGYVAWRRLADSRPPVALANTSESAEGAAAGDGSEPAAEATSSEAGGNDMFARLSRRKEEAAAKPSNDSPWRRDPPGGHSHSHQQTERSPKSDDFTNPNAFSSRRAQPPVEAEIKEPMVVEVEETADEPVAGEPRKLPELETPSYARRRQPVVEEDAPPTQEEPAQPARRYGEHRTEEHGHGHQPPNRLTVRTPIEVEAPANSADEPLAEEPRPLVRQAAQPPIRGVVAGAEDVSNANAYDTRNTRPAPPPRALHTSSPAAPYNDRNAYDPATGAPPAGGPKNYAAPDSYGGPANPTAAGTPHRRGDKYVVQPNDSYWVISTRLYGQGGFYRALYEHNRAKYPSADKLKPGDAISAPELAVLERDYADLCPRKPSGHAGQGAFHPASHTHGGKIYKVREGDTLYDIARYELGKAARWNEIYELNRERLGEDFDYLPPGMSLALPGPGGVHAPGAHPPGAHPPGSGQPVDRYHTPGAYGGDRVTTRPGEAPR